MYSDIDVTLILTIVGILAAICGPIIGWLLRSKDSRQLDVVLEKEVFLVSQLANDLDNFSIVIDGEPASDQVVWITGWIINSGNYDISERIVEKPLTLTLPEDLHWSNAKVPHCSRDVSCEVEIVEPHKLEFQWSLLRSGEYVHFDALLRCPIDESSGQFGEGSFVKTITPYSRIENIRTDAITSLAEIGERYNPKTPRERYLGPKFLATFFAFAVYVPFFMSFVYPFELDQFFGDGFLPARPVIETTVDDVSVKLAVSVNSQSKVKVDCPQSAENEEAIVCGEHVFDTPTEVFANNDIRVGRFAHRDRMQEPGALLAFGVVTIFTFWVLVYMWFPGFRIFGSKKRRTAAALYALRTQKPDTKSNSTNPDIA